MDKINWKAVIGVLTVLATLITIVGFCTGKLALSDFFTGNSSATASSTPVAQSSAVGSPQQIPTATPATISITKDLQLQCIDCNTVRGAVVATVLQRIIIDPVAGTTTMYFKITDDDPADANARLMTFSKLTMQNQSDGTLIHAAEEGNESWSLNYQNSLIKTGTFLVVPQHGSTWALSVSLGCCTTWNSDYKDIILAF